MDLEDMKGLGTTTKTRLHKGGINTVEQLALVDTRRKRIDGVKRDRLIRLRREAQKAIFSNATTRFRSLAGTAATGVAQGAQTLDRLARQATQNAVAAAKEAEAYAQEALKHAEAAAVDLADRAAEQAARAQRAAQQQLQILSGKIAVAGEKTKPVLEKYLGLLQRAEAAATDAAGRASAAATRAREASVAAAQRTQVASRSLYRRLIRRMGREKA